MRESGGGKVMGERQWRGRGGGVRGESEEGGEEGEGESEVNIVEISK